MKDTIIEQSVKGENPEFYVVLSGDSSDGAFRKSKESIESAHYNHNKIHIIDRNLLRTKADQAADTLFHSYFVMLPTGWKLLPEYFATVSKSAEATGADFLYCDEADTEYYPAGHRCKPDFSFEYLRCSNFIGESFVFAGRLLSQISFEQQMSADELVFRLTEKARVICHVDSILAQGSLSAGIDAAERMKLVSEHLTRSGENGTVLPGKTADTCHPVFEIKGQPLVSIIIPNSDHAEDLEKLIESIREKTTWNNYEIVVVENNSCTPEIKELYCRLSGHENYHIAVYDGVFNFAAIVNLGVKCSRGEYVILLNNDMDVITPNWIEEMLMYAQKESVGVVGAMLLYPDNTIQHAGMILGTDTIVSHAFRYYSADLPGYMNRLVSAQAISSITGACMMAKRTTWDRLQGMDESYPVEFNDVDLCLRAQAAGLSVVWTPFAVLHHFESKSRYMGESQEQSLQSRNAKKKLMEEHSLFFQSTDRFYNRNLWSDTTDNLFSIRPVAKPCLYILGLVLYFQKAMNNARFYCVSGFAGPEKKQTWSKAENAIMKFLIPEKHKDLDLCFKAASYHNVQRILIEVNGEYLTTVKVGLIQTHHVIIPKERVSEKELIIKFHFPDAYSPLSRGESSDPRILGAAFYEMSINNISK